MPTRRSFLKDSVLKGSTYLALGAGYPLLSACSEPQTPDSEEVVLAGPQVVSTWDLGLSANEKAWEILEQRGSGLDAVEQGVRIVEADPTITTVGFGGTPDREGRVTLDACIMDSQGNCGAVCFLEHIKHPISVARLVMEKTPHVMLAGEGALQFALEQGFTKENLLTEDARLRWEKWKVESQYKPIINIENHDTIGMLCLDHQGNISGACTTSGLGYKMRGRIGDSPIIGAGLFIDNEVGGAVATGLGEAIWKTLGAFLAVELMRSGKKPEQACKEVIERITKKQPGYKDFQVGLVAMNKTGEVGGYSIHEGFNYAHQNEVGNHLRDAPSYL